MLILSLDTTTRAGSYALWRDGALVEERVGDAARTHAERLPGDLADLLAAHGLAVGDVDVYAVASGPGSFTGLRVGIATVQGLALVHDRKVVPISALYALAHRGAHVEPDGASALVVGAWMEAYRGEVFGALYRMTPERGSGREANREAGGREAGAAGEDDALRARDRKPEQGTVVGLEEIAGPTVASPAALAAEWRRLWPTHAPGGHAVDARRGVIIGDGVAATRTLLEDIFPDALLIEAVPLAGTIARLADAHPERAVRPHAIVPLYVRRPDAELARDRTRDPKEAAGPPHATPATTTGPSPSPVSSRQT